MSTRENVLLALAPRATAEENAECERRLALLSQEERRRLERQWDRDFAVYAKRRLAEIAESL